MLLFSGNWGWCLTFPVFFESLQIITCVIRNTHFLKFEAHASTLIV